MLAGAAVGSRAALGRIRPGGLNVGHEHRAQRGSRRRRPHPHARATALVGDVNFMTTVGETRVLPEELDDTWARVKAKLATNQHE